MLHLIRHLILLNCTHHGAPGPAAAHQQVDAQRVAKQAGGDLEAAV